MDWKNHILKVGGYAVSFDEPEATDDYRRRIEPWLSAVLQAEHLSLLLGSGLSIAIANAADSDALDMSRTEFGLADEDKVNEYAEKLAFASGRGGPNIEDQFNAAIALATGLAVQQSAAAEEWNAAIRSRLTSFMHSVLRTEAGIANAVESGKTDPVDLLVSFLMTFASRAASRERPHIFTTNYDRLIEWGCDWIGLRVLDRFVGTLAPVFRASRLDVDFHYNPPGIRGEPRYLEGS